MKKTTLFFTLVFLLTTICMAQNVGIGTTTPLARLHVTDSSVVFSASGDIPVTPHNPPIEGAGRRMLWYPDKAAFRVGYTSVDTWDANNIGIYSVAMGNNCLANGDASIAMGYNSVANGSASIAMGFYSTALDDYSTAMGQSSASSSFSAALGRSTATNVSSTATGRSTASGVYSTAMGWSTASGESSTAIGNQSSATGSFSMALGTSYASGVYSTAIGNSTASGDHSTAIGQQSIASGNNSIAIGTYVSTNNQSGSFIIGDGGDGDYTHVFGNDASNQMLMRFVGGYKLYTTGWGSTIGAQLTPGATSWSAVSDVHKKENFVPVDDESVLQKIKNFKLSTWNYKGQDAHTMRHYGPMAQDFYGAFGKDALGKIGCDTLINEHDFISINFIAIQALEKRTQQIEILQKENSQLQNKNVLLQKKLEDLAAKLETLQKQFEGFALLQKENNTLVTTNK